MTAPLPFCIFPSHLDGIYRRFRRHEADGAAARGWIPAPGAIQVVLDLLYHDYCWLRWIDCECGRQMPLPPWEEA